MEEKLDVLVIGGGATGVGICRDLSMRGLSVMLVEKSGLCDGTSGRSHGLLHSGARYANSDKEGARECIEENRIIKEIGGLCIEDTGGMFVQLKSDDDKYFREKVNSCEEIGIPTEVIGGDIARNIEPKLSNKVQRAMKVPDSAIYPSRLVSATAKSAENNGGEIYINSPVEDIIVGDNEIKEVEIGGEFDGSVYPDYVVNSTGAWAEQCAELAGLEVSMKPTKGVMVSVDFPDLNTVINRCRITNDGDIVIPHQNQAVLGTTSVEVDKPENYTKEDWEVDLMFKECGNMIPELSDEDIERTYWGVRPLYDPDESHRSDSDNTGKNRSISRGFNLIDHTDDGVNNFCTVVGGKLTTHRLMAEETSDFLASKFGNDSDCRTHIEKLPYINDETNLDQLVREYSAVSPTDIDVIEKNS
jgi:glycerol-3-phosphate dehydrogenase